MSAGIKNVGFENEIEIVKNGKEVSSGQEKQDEEVNESPPTGSCGWRGCKPITLQRMASPRWLLFVICTFVFIQNIVTNGFVNVSITTLERRFDLSSSQAALISGGYDVAAGLGVVPVSYYCSSRHKGTALTAGLILYGFGALVFSSPHFIAPKYNLNGDGAGNGSEMYCTVGIDEPCSSEDVTDQDLSKYLYVFIFAQLMMGLAATPIYTIGITYLDENVKHKVIGAYIGVFLMVAILSGALGYIIGGIILNSVYVNVLEDWPTDVLPGQWMGAWWIGFVFFGFSSFLAAIPMSCFPSYLPGYDKVHQEKVEASQMKGDDEMIISRTDFGKWKELPSAIWRLLRNTTYMLVSLGSCFQAIIKMGVVVFLPKLLETMFLLSAGTAASITGGLGTTVGVISTILVGWAIKRWKLSLFGMLKLVIVSAVVITVTIFSFFLKCPEPPLAGVSEAYTPSHMSKVDLNAECNEDCPCTDTTYDAVCGSDGRVYFDACYAGCKMYNEQAKTFYNCSCVPNDDVVGVGSASVGACATMTCATLYIFLAVLCINVACTFIPGPPLDNITLRCVSHDQRSLALAVQWVLARCLGTIPGPFLFGSMLDISCILWNRNCDGSRGRCHRYDRSLLSILIVGSSVVCSFISLFFYGFAYFSHKRRTTKASSEVKVSLETKNTQF
ncbi:solute carrier organic anion transporter family member 4A1-like [Antedon mediterranea]|uniref:solute carrier organic anion transporter family member 4A1-like n=1 Tax=Antedon mediterranea TaxID=105859 RepID=UPI003AF48572